MWLEFDEFRQFPQHARPNFERKRALKSLFQWPYALQLQCLDALREVGRAAERGEPACGAAGWRRTKYDYHTQYIIIFSKSKFRECTKIEVEYI